jgi:hypothetical protein
MPDLTRAGEAGCGGTWPSPSSYLALLTDGGFTYPRTQKVYKSRAERDILAVEEQIAKNGSPRCKTRRRR